MNERRIEAWIAIWGYIVLSHVVEDIETKIVFLSLSAMSFILYLYFIIKD